MGSSDFKNIDYILDRFQYKVPSFQRSYSWTDRHLKSLWEDILYSTDNKCQHYIGSIIVSGHPDSNYNITKLSLIDGQQRLVTLSVLLLILSKHIKDGRRVNPIIKKLYVDRKNYPEEYRISVTKKDFDVYNSIMTGKRSDGKDINYSWLRGKRLGNCYNFFERELKNISNEYLDQAILIDLYETVNERLKFIIIEIDEEMDPSTVFESLNHKNQPLTRIDLLRNYVMMLVEPLGHDSAEKFHDDVWQKFEKSLHKNGSANGEDGDEYDIQLDTDNELDEFLRYYLMKSGKRVAQKATYVVAKEEIDSQIKNISKNGLDYNETVQMVVKNYLETLFKFTRYYRYIIGLDKYKNKEIQHSLDFLRIIRSKSHRCYLLGLFDEREEGHISEKQFVESMKIVESYIARRVFTSFAMYANVVDVLFIELCNNCTYRSEDLYGHLNALTDKLSWPDNKITENALGSSGLGNNTDLCVKLMQRICLKRNPYEEVVGKISLEHIMPRAISEWVDDAPDEQYETYHNEYVNRLGNLTLLSGPLNSKIKNSVYRDKLIEYDNCNFLVTQDLVKNYSDKQWNKATIDERSSKMIKEILSIWPR